MKVLIACERSGIIRNAFLEKGHNAFSCDIEPTQTPGPHIQADILTVLKDNWDLMIAHPPCTYLAVVGMNWNNRILGRNEKTAQAIEFVKALWAAPILKICIENPISVLSTRWKKPSQIIEPFYFGDPEKKATSLWLKNLPRLNGLIMVAKNKKAFFPAPYKVYPNGRRQYFEGKTTDGRKEDRAYLKAKTFPGIAAAMANQWG